LEPAGGKLSAGTFHRLSAFTRVGVDPARQHDQSRVIDSLIESGQKKHVIVGAEMDAQLSQDERRAVAERIFTALCAHYPDRYIAFFERPRVLNTSSPAAPVRAADDSADGEADANPGRSP
jgi:hypothetical protein